MSKRSTYCRHYVGVVVSGTLALTMMAGLLWSYLGPPTDPMPALNRYIIPYFQHMATHQEHKKETPIAYFLSKKITEASSHKPFRPTPPHFCLPLNHSAYGELLQAYQLTLDTCYHVAAPNHPERLAYATGLYELWLAAACFNLPMSEIIQHKHNFVAAATSLRPYGFLRNWHASSW